jgi:hypothetical protein
LSCLSVFRCRSIAPGAIALLAALFVFNSGASAQDYGGYRPHYQGYGVNTRGGRGGAILRVTNLNDSGPGSLRAALNASGARFVIFEVSGTIALSSAIIVTNPFITIAGQTAPSPGITVRNHTIILDTHDVVFQHVRLRLGDTACVDNCSSSGADALLIRNNAFNIVLDHLSISWGTHGGLSINAWTGPEPTNIAMLDCIVSENLKKPPIVPRGIGTLWMPSADGYGTFARNLHAHNGNRMPWISPGWQVSGYNNVAYNAYSLTSDVGSSGFMQLMLEYGYPWPVDVAWISNVAIAGLDTHPDGKPVKVKMLEPEASQPNRLYLADNTGPHQTLANQWGGVTFQELATEARIRSNTIPSWHQAFNFAILPNASVLSHVLANAGARPLDRDSVDVRVVQDVRNRTGRAITTPSDVGGYPILAQNRRVLAVPASPHAVVDTAGRTAIEAWLESFARALEPTRSQTGVPAPPTNLRIAQ